jgi:hypothetical protein
MGYGRSRGLEFYASVFLEASFLALPARYVSPVILTVSVECSSRSRMASKMTASQIEYTDFPPDGITLYFTNNTILLPSEY